MAEISWAAFLDLLQRSNLLALEVQAEVAAWPEKAPKSAALRLVRERKLTRWQAQFLLAGRHHFFLGPYKLLDKIGAGGMGAVFKAQHSTRGDIVAIKVLLTEGLKNPQLLTRFQREIESLSSVRHPNIIRALDARQLGKQPYLVMEYVEGKDLKVWLDEYGKLPIDWSCECIRQAALGLEHAREKGLVHRDIKPGNLLVVSDDTGGMPQVKILDLGLARYADREKADELTETGQIMGSVDYMAPEQAENCRTADIRADIFALGCTLYRLLTGEMAFAGETVMEKLMARIKPAPLIRARRADIPPVLEEVIAKMLALKPADRYQTPAEVARALGPFAMGTKGTGEPSSLILPRHEASSLPLEPARLELEGQQDLKSFFGELASQAGEPERQAQPALLNPADRTSISPPDIAEPKKRRTGWIIAGITAACLLVWGIASMMSDQAGEPSIANLPKRTIVISTKREPPPPTSPAPSLPAVDLLPLLNLSRDRIAGDWTLNNGVLRVGPSAHARIQVPYLPPENYTLRCTAVRTSGQYSLVLGLVVEGKQCDVTLSGWNEQSGLESIDGKIANENTTTVQRTIFRPGRACEIECQVRGPQVTVMCDGRELIAWRGDTQQLSLPDHWRTPREDALFVAAFQSSFNITRFEVIPTGREAGTILRSDP